MADTIQKTPKSQKVAVVTGVSSGIGRACACLLNENGFSVIGLDITQPSVEDHKFFCEFHQIDLAKCENIETVVQKITKNFEKLDVLVNAAGIHQYTQLSEQTVEEFDRVMAVNVRAPWYLVKCLTPLLAKSSAGSVVNVSSVHGHGTGRTTERRTAYTTSKGALSALTSQLAIELAPYRVRVNAVQPGAVLTNMMTHHLRVENPSDKPLDRRLAAEGASNGVVHRLGSPSEIAECVFFLADSSRSSFINGAKFTVDGGLVAIL